MRGLVQGTGLLLGAPFIFLLGIGDSPFVIYLTLALFGTFPGHLRFKYFCSPV